MKIIDLAVTKVGPDLVCRVTLADGSKIGSDLPWRNPLGIWASDDDARSPGEIAAVLRNFARAIEEAAARDKAA